MRTILLWAFFLLCSSTTQAYQFEANGNIALTGEVALASKYVVRGVNASDGPVVQASVTAMHVDSGCYAKVWGTQLNFDRGDPTNSEIDLSAGCGGSKDGISWDLNLTRYVFVGAPKSLQYDFNELVMYLARDFRYFTVGGEAAMTLDYFGAGKEAMYWRGIVTVPLGDKWSLTAHSGKQSINYAVNTKSYSEWAAGIIYQPSERINWYLGFKDAGCNTCESGIIGKVRIAF